ncbi:hypothetical protein SAMD00019534_018250 [Acytostelium subglobosum LB1]|uniref:hypothetical protein n=1 Tax=Acytostelium subglobosum LB1 TaxID=1410327 RepID=UPI000644DED8|nr:hypothetical protein SAMD00019534_018250 [Acytostelium subglobosum LB1]GAM18650.1 hypothetical protein SAMD00019534_018250 [Acytostelium subglobosum LB1]|eukprot:XP_012757870.1 hypothetical protein SAMD00019534_018250 [Acytostelium subglobosum LB1]
MFSYGPIDKDTFNAVHNKYQQFFKDQYIFKHILYNAIVKSAGSNTDVVSKLLFNNPNALESNNLVLGHILNQLYNCGAFEMIKVLHDTGHNIEVSKDHTISCVFRAPAASIRYFLDPNNKFNPKLINLVKSSANLPYYASLIISKGDQQLINELLTIDVVRQIKGSPIDQSDTKLNDLTLFYIAKSKSTTLTILSSTSHTSQDTDIGDVKRMTFVNGQARRQCNVTVHQYIITGDCMLIPFMMTDYDKLDVRFIINELIKHGNVTQIIVALGVLDNVILPNQTGHHKCDDRSLYFGDMYNAFLDSELMSKSLEVIKYLNDHHVVQTMDRRSHLRDDVILDSPRTQQALEFLMSIDNKIFPLALLKRRLVLFEPRDIDYVLNNNPSFFEVYTYVGRPKAELDVLVYTYHAAQSINNYDLGLVRSILNAIPPGHRSGYLESTFLYFISNGRMNMDVIKMMLQGLQFKPTYSLLSLLGASGDVGLFDCVFKQPLES